MNAEQVLGFAHHLADRARPIALRYFRTPLDIMPKADESPVTVADREIENILRHVIRERYPHHGIIGEEYGSIPRENSWVLDPIDGTASFVIGNPLFGTLIGLLRSDEPFAGLIDIPVMRERWAGDGKQHTTYYDQHTAHAAMVSACRSLSRARLYHATYNASHTGESDAVDALSERVAVSRPSCDCYAYGLLASGYCDLVLEDGLEPFDYLPIVPVVLGAGGWMSDWSGNPLGLHSDGRVIAAATKTLLDATIDALRNS
ncbi:histidinol-phosphatase, inositol monophosphatase family [Nitrosovibrio tenuis]|uniref:Histidinol-phosphatase, inositol monophosphatase family n=2 Tax=Nitrosovibrio tenuis TaxID=1233 RepID=A0A1H7K6J5_9PROT|nr:histidinol-phosphatase, inositol monophosphatase family [Nitrosovibrio tenuis]